jgi:MoxR-like ATPase
MDDQQAQEMKVQDVQNTAPQDTQAESPDQGDPVMNRKFDMWERKLLDLSLRNNLLNSKKTQMIRLLVEDPSTMEDRLNSEKDYKICPLSEIGLEEKDYGMEDMPKDEEGKISKEFESDKIYTDMTRGALDDKIKDMFRKGKVAEEENGASSLYLATAFLRWRQKDSDTDLYAPLLLIPCDITRKSIVLGYKVKRRDEDTLLNITIIEKLRQDFGIEIPDFAEGLPQDASGVDVKAVIETVKAAIEGLEGWDVVNTVLLGLFSFSRFVMWNDMHANRNKIAENDLVKSLYSGAATPEILEIDRSDAEEEDVFLPLTADSSQINAIKAATHDETFVLHGPPGTGKSQTITSMIADGIANGRTILFAAEKKVALDVVYSRLEKIGIAPFCLELHSNKAKKSYVLEQLRIASELRLEKHDPSDYDRKLKEMTERRRELDGYVAALHKRQDNGYTVYELINMYAQNESAPDTGAFPAGFFDGFKAADVTEIESLLGEMAAARSEGTEDLSFVRATEYNQTMRDSVGPAASKCREDIAKVIDMKNRVTESAGRFGVVLPESDGTKASLASLANTVSGCLACSSMPSYFLSNDTEKSINDIIAMSDIYSSAYAMKDDLLTRWDPDFLTRDPKKLQDEFDDAQGKIGPLRSMAVNSLYKKIKDLDKTNGQIKDGMRNEFTKLAQYNETLAKAESFYDQYRAVMPAVTSSAEAAGIKASALSARDEFAKVSGTAGVSSYIKALSSDADAKASAEGFIRSLDELDSSYSAVDSILRFEGGSDFVSLEEASRKMDVILNNEDRLRSYILFNYSASRVRGAGASNIAESFINGDIKADELVPAFRKKLARELAVRTIDSEEALKNFSSDVFEEKVRQFAKADDEFVKVTREEIYLSLLKRLPDLKADANSGSVLGILQHAIKSRGRGVSIRTLFSNIGDFILKLCPCMLMSPISVAQYLEPGKINFDTVIFDEASQIPTAEAIGVLARGRNAVIVGDPNQMPPTNFFQAMQTEDENALFDVSDDGIVYDDLESILDDCLAINMPSMYLAWHYRSHHESLITFSNRSFYDGKLYTFPSADNRVSKVTLVDAGGTFDRGKKRVNEVEAKAVVEDIYRRFKEGGGKPCSIGVVTFNINQQNLIDDLISAKCGEDREFEEWVYGQEEPVFVKNLENVQGDERDVILFSVAYGKDEEGKIYMNFGPLNRDGGWRRLNVAVTRSRDEMKVFSSLRPEDIKLNDGSSDGVVAFRRFLDYAYGNSAWDYDLQVVSGADNQSPVIDRSAAFTGVADQIIARLEEEGYSCDRNIGKSSFKVDIGIADKETPDVYRLGILLDGPSYFASKTTSAREVSQPSLLKGLGWKLLRVRVIEWWESPDKVMDEIRNALNKSDEIAEEGSSEEVPAEADAPAVEETATEETVPVSDAAEDPVWTCECGQEGNTGRFCHECGKPRPEAGAAADSEDDASVEGEDVKKN